MRYKRAPKPYRLDIPPERISAGKKETSKLLRRERREWARKRLEGIGLLLAGQPLRAAARSIGVKPDTVSGWFRTWRDRGCVALLANPPAYEPRQPLIKAGELAHMELAVRDLLEQDPKPDARSQQRLRAILIALTGSIDEAADSAYARPSSVRRWLAVARQYGPTALLEKRHTGRPRRRAKLRARKRKP